MTFSAMFSMTYFLLLVPLYLHMRYRQAKKQKRFIYLRTEIVLACLFIYTNVLLYLTVFPNRFSASRDQVSVNLMPLQSIYQNLHAFAVHLSKSPCLSSRLSQSCFFKFGREHFVICTTWFFSLSSIPNLALAKSDSCWLFLIYDD